MTEATTTTADVIAFITLHADDEDLDRVFAALKDRRKALRSVAGATVTRGGTYETRSLSPRYLNGLVGKVVTIKGQRADLELHTESTAQIVGTKYGPWNWDDTKPAFVLRGIPTSALRAFAVDAS